MFDMASVTAAYGSLKALTQIAKGLISLKSLAEVQSVAIELNEKIIAAHQDLISVNEQQAAMIKRIGELEGQIAAMKDWDTEKQRYKLASPASGAVVYALKRAMSNGEPPHYLCANCYKQGKQSFLNDLPSKRTNQWNEWVCPTCGSSARTGYSDAVRMKYAEDIPVPQ